MAKWQLKRFRHIIDFSGLEWQNFLKFDLVVSKWPKFYNWDIISKNVIDFIPKRPHQTLCTFLTFWVGPAFTKLSLHMRWYSVISCRSAIKPTLNWRGDPGLSDEPKLAMLISQISQFSHDYTTGAIAPCTFLKPQLFRIVHLTFCPFLYCNFFPLRRPTFKRAVDRFLIRRMRSIGIWVTELQWEPPTSVCTILWLCVCIECFYLLYLLTQQVEG